MYSREISDPIKEEISRAGLINLQSPEEVETFIKDNESKNSILLVNSVCGCAAGIARPALYKSLDHPLCPTKGQLGSVFAGVDIEATEKARSYMLGYSHSSPSIAFFREGELSYLLERHSIEGLELNMLRDVLESIYKKFFSAEIREDVPILNPLTDLKIKPNDFKQYVLLDCRSLAERENGFIPESKFLDQELANEIITGWDKDEKMLLYCKDGTMSIQAVIYFKKHGFKNVFCLDGGYQGYQGSEPNA